MNTEDTTIQAQGINWRSMSLAVLGLVFIVYGMLLPPHMPQKELFFAGSVFLFTSSLIERKTFFATLQVVILSGTLIAFAPVILIVKAAVPITLSFFAVGYFLYKGMLRDYLMSIGCVGLLVLAAGYAISNPIVYLFGGLFLSIYSYVAYRRGDNLALIFTILNVIFLFGACFSVYHQFLH